MGDNTGGGNVMLRPIGFIVFVTWISIRVPLFIHMVDLMYT